MTQMRRASSEEPAGFRLPVPTANTGYPQRSPIRHRGSFFFRALGSFEAAGDEIVNTLSLVETTAASSGKKSPEKGTGLLSAALLPPNLWITLWETQGFTLYRSLTDSHQVGQLHNKQAESEAASGTRAEGPFLPADKKKGPRRRRDPFSLPIPGPAANRISRPRSFWTALSQFRSSESSLRAPHHGTKPAPYPVSFPPGAGTFC